MKKLLFLFPLLLHNALAAQIINIEDRRMKNADSTAFYGFADLGFNLLKNDKRLLSTRTAVQLEYQRIRHVWMFLGGHNLISAQGNANLQNEAFGHFRYNYRLPKYWTLEAFNQVQFNERTRLKLRYLAGTGLRLRLHRGKTNRFYIGASVMYEHGEFNDSPLIYNDIRLSHYFSYYVRLGTHITLAQTTYFQPLAREWTNHRLSSEGTLNITISKRLKFLCRANLVYDNDPRLPENIPNSIYSWTNGLRIEF